MGHVYGVTPVMGIIHSTLGNGLLILIAMACRLLPCTRFRLSAIDGCSVCSSTFSGNAGAVARAG